MLLVWVRNGLMSVGRVEVTRPGHHSTSPGSHASISETSRWGKSLYCNHVGSEKQRKQVHQYCKKSRPVSHVLRRTACVSLRSGFYRGSRPVAVALRQSRSGWRWGCTACEGVCRRTSHLPREEPRRLSRRTASASLHQSPHGFAQQGWDSELRKWSTGCESRKLASHAKWFVCKYLQTSVMKHIEPIHNMILDIWGQMSITVLWYYDMYQIYS